MTGTGFCECGCGERTSIPRKTDRGAKMVKGRPQRFLPGHNFRGLKRGPVVETRWVEEDRGYRTPCWSWLLCKTRNGYGRLTHDNRNWLAHRLNYVLRFGPVPEGLDLDHLCRNKDCVNPDHLEPVTRGENMRRAFAAKRLAYVN